MTERGWLRLDAVGVDRNDRVYMLGCELECGVSDREEIFQEDEVGGAEPEADACGEHVLATAAHVQPGAFRANPGEELALEIEIVVGAGGAGLRLALDELLNGGLNAWGE